MLKIQRFIFSPIQENTYLLSNEAGDCAIFDPGCYDSDEKEQLAEYIKNAGLKPVLLINTHGHLDHIFGNKFVAETYNLKPHIHEAELPVLKFAATSGLMYNLPFDTYTGDLIFIKEGDTIQIGEDVLEVLFTPGHSPGSLSFYCAKQHFILSGDVLFQRSIGRTDLPLGNHETLLKSIREKLFTLPGETIVYSGHGPETNIADEKKLNPFLN